MQIKVLQKLEILLQQDKLKSIKIKVKVMKQKIFKHGLKEKCKHIFLENIVKLQQILNIYQNHQNLKYSYILNYQNRKYMKELEGGHYIFRKDFARDEKNGGLKCINEVKVNA